jgi:hypothetical protein
LPIIAWFTVSRFDTLLRAAVALTFWTHHLEWRMPEIAAPDIPIDSFYALRRA